MNKTLLLTSLLLCSLQANANQQEQNLINDRANEQKFTDQKVEKYEMKVVIPKTANVATNTAQSATMTKEELAKQPDLIIRAIIPALAQNDIDTVKLILPLYENMPAQYQEQEAILWGKAILARSQQDYKNSIQFYRTLLADNAHLVPARLQLAIALFENNELEAAKDQFDKLTAEKLSAPINELINQYQAEIRNKDEWIFRGNATYLNDPNLNNAPKSGTKVGRWQAAERESGQGIGYGVEVGKKWSLGDGFFSESRLNSNGKYYWDNKKFNELTVRASQGIGFQNAKHLVAVLPFAEYMWYAGGRAESQSLKRYSKGGGGAIEWQYRLAPQWLLNSFYEYGEQRYPHRQHLNGNYHFISENLTYLANSKQYWFAGVNYHRLNTRDKDDSYWRRGINLGWGQEWGKGLSTRLSLSYGQKRYKASMPIFDLTQRNREYGVTASVWHRAIHFWGVTPRLTYAYQKVKSNHAFYSYDKNRVYFELTKTF